MADAQTLMTFRELFERLLDTPYTWAVYSADVNEPTLDTVVTVLDPMETEDPDDVPSFAKTNALGRFLSVSAIQEVQENAKNQLARVPDDAELLTAVLYYRRHDAFQRLRP